MSRKAAGLPDISRPTSKPSFMPSFFCASAMVSSRTSRASVAPIFLRQVQPIGVHVGDDDVARSGVAHHRGRHDADGPGPGDQHVLAQHRERQGRVDGVAERVEDGGHVAVDARVVVPDVGHRQRDVLGEGAGTVDADALGVLAQMAAAGQAIAAAAADDVPLAADDLAGMEVRRRWSRPRRSRRRTRGRRPSAPGMVFCAQSSHL